MKFSEDAFQQGHDDSVSVSVSSADEEERFLLPNVRISLERSSDGTTRKPRWKQRRHCPAWAVPILYLAMNGLYLASLKGTSTPKEMTKILGLLGFCLVGSVLFASAFLWSALWQTGWTRRVALAAFLITPVGWYILDSGNRLGSHGSYNLLVFFVILIPLNLTMLLWYNWYKLAVLGAHGSKRRFTYQVIATAVVLGVLLLDLTSRNRERSKLGFFGIEVAEPSGEQDSDMCSWSESTAWVDLLPVRQNIFVGSMTCPKQNSFSAYFEGDQLVIEDCSDATTVKSYRNDSVLASFSGAGYSILPGTDKWGYPLKRDHLKAPVNELQMHILEFIDAHTFPYDGPQEIPSEVDTVLAHCGNAEAKLVYRIPRLNSETEEQTKAKRFPGDKLNVVTLFVDSVSRPAFHKRLPKTVKALESAAHYPIIEKAPQNPSSKVSLFEFFRYHVVGMNTGPNTRAMWAGQPEANYTETEPLSEGKALWQQFHDAGYITGRIDSMCQDWDAYYNPSHYPPKALAVPPTLDHEFISYSCIRPYLPLKKSDTGNFAGAASIKPRCLSGQHQSSHVLDISELFIERYTREDPRPFYLNAGFMDAHEGSGEMLAAIDDRLSTFLDPSTSPIDYTNTAVIILSDHGLLMGLNYAFSHNGKVEHANPFAALALPDWYVSGLKFENSSGRDKLEDAMQKLVTAHDLYETMRGLKGTDDGVDDLNVKGPEGKRRGVDLLRESIPHRTCHEAGIDIVNCYCT